MTAGDEIFPAADVEASFNDPSLQAAHPLSELGEELRDQLAAIRSQAVEAGAPETTRWIFFSSPEWTWMQECGREGWLLYDPESKDQLDFVMTVMN